MARAKLPYISESVFQAKSNVTTDFTYANYLGAIGLGLTIAYALRVSGAKLLGDQRSTADIIFDDLKTLGKFTKSAKSCITGR